MRKNVVFHHFKKCLHQNPHFFHIYLQFFTMTSIKYKKLNILLYNLCAKLCDYLWNSAANTNISSLEGYLDFCSINPVLWHFHGAYYLCYIYVLVINKNHSLYTIEIIIAVLTQWYIVSNDMSYCPIITSRIFEWLILLFKRSDLWS